MNIRVRPRGKAEKIIPPQWENARQILEQISALRSQLPAAGDDKQATEAIAQKIHQLTGQLPAEDGVPLESFWHNAAIHLLLGLFSYVWRKRRDFFIGGNMFIYYSTMHMRNVDFRGPDFFYVTGVKRGMRDSWIVWEENDKYPELIVEFLSETTAREDRTTKKTLYEQTFRTPEYYCYDPETHQLEGWRLVKGAYQNLAPDERGWIWSDVLQMWLGNWEGEYQGQQAIWLRCYNKAKRLVLLREEAEAKKAAAAKRRADAAEAELARLKAWLAQQGLPPQPPVS
jgi:Uma2 family endonuclease